MSQGFLDFVVFDIEDRRHFGDAQTSGNAVGFVNIHIGDVEVTCMFFLEGFNGGHELTAVGIYRVPYIDDGGFAIVEHLAFIDFQFGDIFFCAVAGNGAVAYGCGNLF